jgi:hypothetical protein
VGNQSEGTELSCQLCSRYFIRRAHLRRHQMLRRGGFHSFHAAQGTKGLTLQIPTSALMSADIVVRPSNGGEQNLSFYLRCLFLTVP